MSARVVNLRRQPHRCVCRPVAVVPLGHLEEDAADSGDFDGQGKMSQSAKRLLKRGFRRGDAAGPTSTDLALTGNSLPNGLPVQSNTSTHLDQSRHISVE